MYLIGEKGLGYDAALLGLETKMENRSEKRFGKGLKDILVGGWYGLETLSKTNLFKEGGHHMNSCTCYLTPQIFHL